MATGIFGEYLVRLDFRSMMLKQTNINVPQLCEFLEWDSEYFGFKIARIIKTTLTEHELSDIIDWSITKNIDCLYFLSDPACQSTNYLALDNLFYFVDIRTSLSIDLNDKKEYTYHPDSCVVRSSEESDIPLLREIAKVSHRDTRFYFDPRFPNVLCNKLYEKWIEKSCKDFADVVLVAELERKVVGYISCHLDAPNSGRIGLVAVHSDARGSGIGKKLVMSAMEWFSKNSVRNVKVVTQGRNIVAQKLYQEFGFRSYSTMLWYHKWFNYE